MGDEWKDLLIWLPLVGMLVTIGMAYGMLKSMQENNRVQLSEVKAEIAKFTSTVTSVVQLQSVVTMIQADQERTRKAIHDLRETIQAQGLKIARLEGLNEEEA